MESKRPDTTCWKEHANCDSHSEEEPEDLKTGQSLRKNVFLMEKCLSALPVRALRPHFAGLQVDKEEASLLPLWAVRGQVNQEMRKGFRGRFTIISSGSISEHHRQGTFICK